MGDLRGLPNEARLPMQTALCKNVLNRKWLQIIYACMHACIYVYRSYLILVHSLSNDAQTTYIILHQSMLGCRYNNHRRSTTIINILKRTYVFRSYFILVHSPSIDARTSYMNTPSPSIDARAFTIHRCSDNLHEYTTTIHRRSDIHHPSMLAHSQYIMALPCALHVDEHTYHRRSTTDHGLSTTDGRSYHRQSTIHTLTYTRGYSSLINVI